MKLYHLTLILYAYYIVSYRLTIRTTVLIKRGLLFKTVADKTRPPRPLSWKVSYRDNRV